MSKAIDQKKICSPFFYFFKEKLQDQELEQLWEKGFPKFSKFLNSRFEDLRQGMPKGWLGEEESPYTQQQLGISYPVFDIETLLNRGKNEYHRWRISDLQKRLLLLIETIHKIDERAPEIACAIKHTTGKSFKMAYSGTKMACDYALCSLMYGYVKLNEISQTQSEDESGYNPFSYYSKRSIMSKGISLVIGDSSAPLVNVLPSLFANLITGNVVIIKPHPLVILPLAIVVAEMQKVFSEQGYDPNICQLAIDSNENLISDYLAVHKNIKIIDFFGGTEFGKFLEKIPNKTIFSFKRGINPIMLDSVEDIELVTRNIAASLVFYSGQRLNSFQNIFISEQGIRTSKGIVTLDGFNQMLVREIENLKKNRKMVYELFGAIQTKKTIDRLYITERLGGKIVLKPEYFELTEFPQARVASPLLIECEAQQKELFQHKFYGPIIFIIRTESTDHSIALIKEIAINFGTNICSAYTQDQDMKEKIIEHMALVNVPVSLNERIMADYLDDRHNNDFFKHILRSPIFGPDFILKRFNHIEVWE
ncbi:MAG: aldehyde dehydrogenase family protein [Candidatus Cyclobacteriaceae bacterium M3_2C_046]